MYEHEYNNTCPLCEKAIQLSSNPQGFHHVLFHLSTRRGSGCGVLSTAICLVCLDLYPGATWQEAAEHLYNNHPYKQFEKALALLVMGKC